MAVRLRRVGWGAGVLLVLAAAPAAGAIKVYSPIVDPGEAELETKFDQSDDPRASRDGAYSYNVSLGYGVTDFWAAEIESQWKHDPGSPQHYDSTSFENVFQLTPQGEYWADLGVFAEYEVVARRGDHDNFTLGPLLQKDFGRNVTTVNLLFNHEVGAHGAAPGFTLDARLQSVWWLNSYLAPGFEAYWAPGRLGDFPAADRQELRAGPALLGAIPFAHGKLKYELGAFAGLGRGSPRESARALLEYEFHF